MLWRIGHKPNYRDGRKKSGKHKQHTKRNIQIDGNNNKNNNACFQFTIYKLHTLKGTTTLFSLNFNVIVSNKNDAWRRQTYSVETHMPKLRLTVGLPKI